MAYKTCVCGSQCGVRSVTCPDCNTKFPTKSKREQALKPKGEEVDWKELKRGDKVKVIQGSGSWMEIDGIKHYTGSPGGKYIVKYVDENGIHSYDDRGHSYIYMGKEKDSITGGKLAPHKIKKIH